MMQRARKARTTRKTENWITTIKKQETEEKKQEKKYEKKRIKIEDNHQ